MKSVIKLSYTSEQQVACLDTFQWRERKPQVVRTSNQHVELQNCVNNNVFEDVVTGLASHIVHNVPHKTFKIETVVQGDDDAWCTYRLFIEYDGLDLKVLMQLEDEIFTDGYVCKECNADMSQEYHPAGFACHNCGTGYMPAEAPDAEHADFVFGSTESLYTIPAEHI